MWTLSSRCMKYVKPDKVNPTYWKKICYHFHEGFFKKNIFLEGNLKKGFILKKSVVSEGLSVAWLQ